MNVTIRIDRLVLEGLDVPFAARPAVQAAVEQELARLVMAGGGLGSALAGGTALPSLQAPGISAAGTPAQLGGAIAGAVWSGMGGRK